MPCIFIYTPITCVYTIYTCTYDISICNRHMASIKLSVVYDIWAFLIHRYLKTGTSIQLMRGGILKPVSSQKERSGYFSFPWLVLRDPWSFTNPSLFTSASLFSVWMSLLFLSYSPHMSAQILPMSWSLWPSQCPPRWCAGVHLCWLGIGGWRSRN